MVSKKALVVLDMQEVCVGKKPLFFFKYNKQLVDKINKVIEKNDNVIYVRTLLRKLPLYYISPVRVFDGDRKAELAEGLIKKGKIVFDKFRGNAFSNPKLAKYLKDNGFDTIELVGVDGGGCVSLTALGAIEYGLKVIINTGATDTMFKNRQTRLFKKLKQKGVSFV